MKPTWILGLALAVAGVTTGARAEDLATVYGRALAADPKMQQAEALHMATRETRTQAWLAMLPLDASASKNWVGVGNEHGSTPAIGTLALNVNLFSWNNWINLKQSNAIVAQGEANYLAAQYDLIARVAQQYFAVLSAQDTLTAQESALQSVSRQLEQAERRFEVGLIADHRRADRARLARQQRRRRHRRGAAARQRAGAAARDHRARSTRRWQRRATTCRCSRRSRRARTPGWLRRWTRTPA